MKHLKNRSAGCGFVAAAGLLAGALVLVAPPTASGAPADCWGQEEFSAGLDVDGGGPDIVVGLPSYDLPGKPDAGALAVFSNVGVKGSATPRSPQQSTIVTADDIPGLASQAGARFGSAVSVWSDLLEYDDDDICSDVVVGAPGTTVDGKPGAGRVHLLHGNVGGFDGVTESFDEDSLEIEGGSQAGAAFGSTIAVDTQSALVVGAPRRDIGAAVDAGHVVKVNYVAVNEIGYIETIAQDGGPGGTAESGDRFGEALRILPTGDGPVLLIGTPHEDVGSAKDAGSVSMMAHTGNLQSISQNSPGAGGVAEAGDLFGSSLDAFFTFETSPVGIVSVGVPGEDIGSAKNAGAVAWAKFVIPSPPEEPIGPLTGLAHTTTQDSPGVPDSVQAGDGFGNGVLVGEFGTDGGQRHLVSSSPTEDLSGRTDAGMLSLTRTTEDGHPATNLPSKSWHQDSAGTSGAAESGDRFATAISAVELTRLEDDDDSIWSVIIVTVPGENIGSTVDAGMAYIGLPGSGLQVPLNYPNPQAGAGIGMVPMRRG